jgi:heterodisulfide reductase subunit C
MFWKRPGRNEKPQCSFCHRGEDMVGELISAPSNDSLASTDPCYICGECVAVCSAILEDRADAKLRKIMDSRGMPSVNRSLR